MTLAAPTQSTVGHARQTPPADGVRSRSRPALSQLVPVAASLAIGDLLRGPLRRARVLGSSRPATWLDVGGDVLVVVSSGAIRLPNAISNPDGSIVSGAVLVGGGRVGFDESNLQPVRWWDPVPALPAVDPRAVRRAVRSASGRFRPFQAPALWTALAARDPEGVLRAADGLLGRGPGLTPDGDDVLAAALASYRLIGTALADDRAPATVDAVAEPLADSAAQRTTSLSASLLRHALAGAVADPVAALLRALTGRGRVAEALDRLLLVGHTSGSALAGGVLLGAAAAAGVEQ